MTTTSHGSKARKRRSLSPSWSRATSPACSAPSHDKVSADCGSVPDHAATDRGYGRTVRRSLWVTSADGIDFPHAAQVMRIRRDTLDLDGHIVAREIVHGITTLNAVRGTPDVLAALARGQWGIESVHWIRDTAYAEDANTGYAGNGPQVMATLRIL